MERISKFYKNSKTGNVIEHNQWFWTAGTWYKDSPRTLFSEFYYSPLTDTKSISGDPDLTGYVEISERLYNRIMLKHKRVLKKINHK